MRFLFPDVPADHPAMGSMLMNIAANMLGLGNASTPLGLRAMKDLETLNPRPGVATNAMCTFLAINTSSVSSFRSPRLPSWQRPNLRTLPLSLGLRSWPPVAPRISAVTIAKLLSKLPVFRLPLLGNAEGLSEQAEAKTEEKVIVKESATLQPLQWWGYLTLTAFCLFFVYVFVRLAFPTSLGLPIPEGTAKETSSSES